MAALCTHVNARGVKGALGDAGVANRFWEAAVCQEAPPTVDEGPDDRHGESDGRGGAHESRGQADGEERPHLRKGDVALMLNASADLTKSVSLQVFMIMVKKKTAVISLKVVATCEKRCEKVICATGKEPAREQWEWRPAAGEQTDQTAPALQAADT